MLLQALVDRAIVPAGIGEETLQVPGRNTYRFREVLGVAPLLGLQQQGLQIVPAVLPPLLASEGRSEERIDSPKNSYTRWNSAASIAHTHRPKPFQTRRLSYQITRR